MSKMFDMLKQAEKERLKEIARRLRREVEAAEDADPEEPIVVESPQVKPLPRSGSAVTAPLRRLFSRGRPSGILGPGKGTRDLCDTHMEQLGTLRNSLEAVFGQRNKRVIMFTSALVGEGTTTVATSFARFVVMQGTERVLLLEMNARRPSFSNAFSVNGDGATDYFVSNRKLTAFIQKGGANGVDVLHAGREDPNVIQLHLKRAMPRLLEEAFEHYDTIVIDAPPVMSAPETPAMTPLVDAVVLVVRAGQTKREVVTRALESIEHFEGNVAGIVLNRKKYYIPEFLYRRL